MAHSQESHEGCGCLLAFAGLILFLVLAGRLRDYRRDMNERLERVERIQAAMLRSQ